MVVYREPVTGPRSREIVHRHPAIHNKLATPEPNPNPTLTLTKLYSSKKEENQSPDY